ncbi:ribonuclease T [Pelagibaculum spongiae]|uniref:Ribonuclease T n=2 Tax=Pelagibaculum spongiae TaxID=2080658 RepID=A0A2V1H3C8_9GAMM|nr:ribonuclease T [Pelagibaculum spongiae]
MGKRFRGFLPVVIDVESGGFNAKKDALLEIAAVIVHMNDDGDLEPAETIHFHVEPFEGANIDKAAIDFNGIDPWHPFRFAIKEDKAIEQIFAPVRAAIKASGCTRAVLVGHNAGFDLGFVHAAAERAKIKRNPFHPFSTLDTAALSGLVYGQTVLARAVRAAGIHFDAKEAHSAKYDTVKTAELFCALVNRYKALGGWPLEQASDSDPAEQSANVQEKSDTDIETQAD